MRTSPCVIAVMECWSSMLAGACANQTESEDDVEPLCPCCRTRSSNTCHPTVKAAAHQYLSVLSLGVQVRLCQLLVRCHQQYDCLSMQGPCQLSLSQPTACCLDFQVLAFCLCSIERTLHIWVCAYLIKYFASICACTFHTRKRQFGPRLQIVVA